MKHDEQLMDEDEAKRLRIFDLKLHSFWFVVFYRRDAGGGLLEFRLWRGLAELIRGVPFRSRRWFYFWKHEGGDPVLDAEFIAEREECANSVK